MKHALDLNNIREKKAEAEAKKRITDMANLIFDTAKEKELTVKELEMVVATVQRSVTEVIGNKKVKDLE